MQIKSRAAWGAGPNRRVDRGALVLSLLTAITVHWPGGGTNLTRLRGAQVAALLRTWQAQHRNQGWADIGYNFLIDGGGTVWEGCGLFRGAHAGSAIGNRVTVGVQLIYGTNEKPTLAQLVALAHLRLWLLARAVKARLLYPHSFWTSTACPGPVRTQLASIPALASKSIAKPVSKETVMKYLYRARRKPIDVAANRPRLIPLEDKHAANVPSSTIIAGSAGLGFVVSHDVVVNGLPKGETARVRLVHQKRGGAIVGTTGWQDIVGSGHRDSSTIVAATGVLQKDRYLRVQVFSPDHDITLREVITRAHYWKA